MDLKNIFKEAGKTIAKYAPELLAGAGIGLWFTATVEAVRVTPRASMLIDSELNYKKKDKLTVKETVQAVGTLYLPAAVAGLAGTGCIIASVSTSNRRYAALSSAYGMLEETARIYRDKVIETIGERKEKEIQGEVAQEKLNRNPISSKEIVITGKGNSLCCFGGERYFESEINDVKMVLNGLNERLLQENYISLNEVYLELGLEPTNNGSLYGWSTDYCRLIDWKFSSKIAADGRPCLVIDYWPNYRPGFDSFY